MKRTKLKLRAETVRRLSSVHLARVGAGQLPYSAECTSPCTDTCKCDGPGPK